MLVAGDQVGRWVVDEVITMGTPIQCLCHDAKHPEVKASVTFCPTRYRELTEGINREANALRQLDHPAVPTLHSSGQNTFGDDEVAWVATQPLRGKPLSDRVSAGSLDWKEACRLIHQVASGLAHVHDHALVHRDVTPEKILVSADGRAQLVGFDLAMDETRLARSASGDLPMGDLSYSAPEVIDAQTASDARSDLYSLGVVLFQCLTGHSPFPASIWGGGGSRKAKEWKAKSAPLDPAESAPKWLSNLVRRATDPSPEKRLPDVDAFVGWLDAAEASWQPAEEQPPAAAPTPPIPVMMPTPSLISPPRAPGPPMVVMHFGAAVLGMVAAMGFSALLILFVELAAT